MTATIILPKPIQDTLTTVVRDCDAEWILNGYTNILIYGSEYNILEEMWCTLSLGLFSSMSFAFAQAKYNLVAKLLLLERAKLLVS